MLHESLRMYVLCKGMEWTHLPVTGGIYDQHPKLLDDFGILMSIEYHAEQRKTKEREDKMLQTQKQGMFRGGRKR